MNGFSIDILEQPAALRYLVDQLRAGGLRQLTSIAAPSTPLLTGMGASYHAALAASFALQKQGVRAMASEATALLYYGGLILERCQEVIYLSQSGASAEVIPFIDRIECGKVYLAITNDLASPLALRAEHVLPLGVQHEAAVACKTYVNSLAILWLLVRHWSGSTDGNELAAVEHAAAELESLLQYKERLEAAWLEVLAPTQTIICSGYAPHYATALQAAQTLAEWAKMPVLGLTGGALRHGFVEVIQPGVGVILFGGSDPAQASTHRLAQDLAGYGAQVLLVEGGRSYRVHPDRVQPLLDSGHEADSAFTQGDLLAQMLDILPVQLFSVALALERNIQPGFRYLGKIVNDL